MIITLLVIAVIGLYIYKLSIKEGDIENEDSERRGLLIKKTDLQERNESMLRMANNMGITIEEVKKDYIFDLEKNNIGTDFKDEILEKMLSAKNKESWLFGVKPENTGSAMMIEWFLEYVRSKEIQELDEELNNTNSLPYTNTDFVSQRGLFDKWEDKDLLTIYEDKIYDVGSLNQIVLVDILKERRLIPCSANVKKNYEMRMQLEERMENSVIEFCKTNPMINTPLAVLAITEAIGIVSEIYKKKLIEGKDEIGLNEFEITILIEETKKKIYNNLIEH